MTSLLFRSIVLAGLGAACSSAVAAEEPPAINPFGPRPHEREDAIPGYLELSDGSVHPGQIYLTRDMRLELFDQNTKRRRDIPLSVVQRIECRIKREWMEKQWRFREGANAEKVYTGRAYPVREYVHILTLKNGETVLGPLNAIVYIRNYMTDKVERFILHERDKGALGADLKSLRFVRAIEFGEKAREMGVERATAQAQKAQQQQKEK